MSPAGPSAKAFRKSWGAELGDEGELYVRVWAPETERLKIDLAGNVHGLEKDAEGWFAASFSRIEPGTPYSFVLDDGFRIPDPASRAQQGDAHGPSLVVDPASYRWQMPDWAGRPWEEAVIYELHIGAFTAEGTFRAAIEKLPHLVRLGVTAVEIMPVAQFSGDRGWGYDGVLLYAPHRAYGSPGDMKAFIDAAHGHGLMVLLDVVYNHFGPDGNYLPRLAPAFFHEERHTPWGAAIAYEKEPVRRFFIENALYWLKEFHLDGLRLDAVDHVEDPLLEELAREVRREIADRPVHLTTEDNRNVTHLHRRDGDGRPLLYTGEWNDDLHNIAHTIATGESEGYYRDFVEEKWAKLARALAEGFVYQGQISPGSGKPRGEPSGDLPPQAFVDFLQNHDQVGNRAFGERLLTLTSPETMRVMMAMLLLSPHTPLLFMGEEWGEVRPFCFFTDFEGPLADAVREGRRKEFAGFSAFAGSGADTSRIPDPNDIGTFEASRVDWQRAESEGGQDWLDFTRDLLTLRRERIVPLLRNAAAGHGRILHVDECMLSVAWRLGESTLAMAINLDVDAHAVPPAAGTAAYAWPEGADGEWRETGKLPARSIVVTLEEGPAAGDAA